MAVRYQGHLARTRTQAVWLGVVMFVLLAPATAWRASTQPIGVAIGLVLLTLAPFALAYQAWHFLRWQELEHQKATPEMMFVFRLLANTPLAMGAILLIVLIGFR